MPDDSFKEFVLDQLGALPELRARAILAEHDLFLRLKSLIKFASLL